MTSFYYLNFPTSQADMLGSKFQKRCSGKHSEMLLSSSEKCFELYIPSDSIIHLLGFGDASLLRIG